jgi:hypothetical protein
VVADVRSARSFGGCYVSSTRRLNRRLGSTLAFGLLDEPRLDHSGGHVGRAFMLKGLPGKPRSQSFPFSTGTACAIGNRGKNGR